MTLQSYFLAQLDCEAAKKAFVPVPSPERPTCLPASTPLS